MNANKPYIIGLTGNIASGKSTASAHLKGMGAFCIDADAISHSLMAPGGEAVEAVRTAFGDAFIREDGWRASCIRWCSASRWSRSAPHRMPAS